MEPYLFLVKNVVGSDKYCARSYQEYDPKFLVHIHAPLPDYNYRHNLSDSLIHQADLLHLQHTSLLMLNLKYRK